MTQGINSQFQRLSFQDLENYVNSRVEGNNDKRVLNLNGEGSFKVSTTDRRYAFFRSESDKRANNETRNAVLDALEGMGLDLNNLSDKMKAAMKYEDFSIKDGKVTSTRPLSAMRLQAIVKQAKAEMAGKVILEQQPQIDDNLKELNNGLNKLIDNLNNADIEGGAESKVYNECKDTIELMHNMVRKDTGNAKGDVKNIADNVKKIQKNMTELTVLAMMHKVPNKVADILMSAHDLYTSNMPELKQVPGFDDSFKNLAYQTVANRSRRKIDNETKKTIFNETQETVLLNQEICNDIKRPDSKDPKAVAEFNAKFNLAGAFFSLMLATQYISIAKEISDIKGVLNTAEQEIGGVKNMSDDLLTGIKDIHDKYFTFCSELKRLPGFDDLFTPYAQEAEQRAQKA